jgi:hypothetical protein
MRLSVILTIGPYFHSNAGLQVSLAGGLAEPRHFDDDDVPVLSALFSVSRAPMRIWSKSPLSQFAPFEASSYGDVLVGRLRTRVRLMIE